jgi:hypothetical protein
MKKNRKLNRLNVFARKEERQKLLAYKQKGYGLYEYKNRLNATVELPKCLADGITKVIQPGGIFQGDDYFMSLVPNELQLVKVIFPAEEERKKENIMNEQKLILDQPDTVTVEGVVEKIIVNDMPLNENDPKDAESKPVLLNEAPLDGVKILG